ncbi:MAG TPA: hypothetical protein VH475_16550 [Tepidisphaeraceae bacterium]
MKYRLLKWYVTFAVLLAPLIAFAAKEDEDTQKLEGRLEGYSTTVRLPNSSTALAYLLICFLGVIALATLFKNAKRTHLD